MSRISKNFSNPTISPVLRSILRLNYEVAFLILDLWIISASYSALKSMSSIPIDIAQSMQYNLPSLVCGWTQLLHTTTLQLMDAHECTLPECCRSVQGRLLPFGFFSLPKTPPIFNNYNECIL